MSPLLGTRGSARTIVTLARNATLIRDAPRDARKVASSVLRGTSTLSPSTGQTLGTAPASGTLTAQTPDRGKR